jgi:hypothetical protein
LMWCAVCCRPKTFWFRSQPKKVLTFPSSISFRARLIRLRFINRCKGSGKES